MANTSSTGVVRSWGLSDRQAVLGSPSSPRASAARWEATIGHLLLVRMTHQDRYWNLLRISCRGKNQSQRTGFAFPSPCRQGKGSKR